MTTPTVAMTKLDAVNRMLASIGQSPVNTLTGTLPKDVNKAVLALDNALRDVLTQGWSFNTDYEYVLTPDGSDRISVPAAAASISPTYGENYTMRWDSEATAGLRLYDNDKHSFDEFTQDVKADVIWLFEYEQLPQHARGYIAMKAGREYQTTIVGSRILYSFTKEMEKTAWATFRRIEKRSKDYNINRHSVAAHRRFNPRR